MASSPRPAPGRPPAVDVTVLDALVESLGAAGSGMRLMLWHTYLQESGPRVARLSAAAAVHDTDVVRHLAHELKSSSALLGAAPMVVLLQRAEDSARAGGLGLVPIAAAVSAEYFRIAAAVNALYEVAS